MKFTSFGAAAVAALMVTATQVSAATVVFDDFSTNQLAVDVAYPGESNSSTIAFGAGNRTLTAQNATNPGQPVAATSLGVSAGALRFSNTDGSTGTGTLTYTMVGDISSGSNPFFYFNVGNFDNVALFTAEVTDGSGGFSSYSELITPLLDPKLFFSQFTGTADFNDVATLSFSISSAYPGGFDGVDGSLNSISISAIPLPAAGLLLMAGLGGLAALRRRKA